MTVEEQANETHAIKPFGSCQLLSSSEFQKLYAYNLKILWNEFFKSFIEYCK